MNDFGRCIGVWTNKLDSTTKYCKNCSELLTAVYCSTCGQKETKDNRSLKVLLGDLFYNLFYLDNRIWLSIRYLLFKPGRMTKDYLLGKRKRYLAPISLFLFINLVFFLVNPTTDYSLKLRDQVNLKVYSEISKNLIERHIQVNDLSFEDYSDSYNRNAVKYAKLFMILNIPIMAIFIYLMTYRWKKFFFDSLLFSLYYFTFFLFCTVMNHFLLKSLPDHEFVYPIIGLSFLILIPLLYSIISVNNYISAKWYFIALIGIGNYLSLFLSLFLYQIFNFSITYTFT